ncbi:MAG: hypothetical protein ABGZ23_02885 [Fuerstiella sp.]|nr:hypothetical protein [Fuerstiella sp.]
MEIRVILLCRIEVLLGISEAVNQLVGIIFRAESKTCRRSARANEFLSDTEIFSDGSFQIHHESALSNVRQ